ncbi:hypothetical protein [Streptococcus parasanguinis]|uniref:hypothetical protein n=1 Tax=Streptococcus parasanguinis TaxID=1318 RepID=UPI000C7E4E41|nr:hypothetical protein [Streptococcus parasanguinis]PKZ97446.1 hypothetical protein CYK20_03835 [Streptococcus parasanguinis]
MKKGILFFVSVLVMLAACSNTGKQESSKQTNESQSSYYQVTSDDISITKDATYSVTLTTKDTWQFVAEAGQDVTDWLVLKSDKQALTDTSGVAQITAVDSDSSAITITIDSSKITGFSSNGGANLYIMPDSSSIVGTGDNHAHYSETSAKIGKYVIPKVSVDGTIEGEVTHEDGLTFKNNQITFKFTVDGKQVDSSLVNNSTAKVTLADGDGYYTTDYVYSDKGLSNKIKNASINYSIKPEDLQITNSGYVLGENGGGRGWSELGGDGNGNYNLNFELSGLKYNGLPISNKIFKAHIYCYGRTFKVDNGSIYATSYLKWSTDSENNLPNLADQYSDNLILSWANGINASKLSEDDVTLTMESEYGDTLKLKRGTDFTLETSKTKTIIEVNYTYWANAPVYTKLKVDVDSEKLNWDDRQYKISKISHSYDIASVYVYNVMAGGQTGTQTWTVYGLDGLTDWQQLFDRPTYTLSYIDTDGKIRYYSEASNGSFVDEANATTFDASGDVKIALKDNTGYFTRRFDQTEDKTIGGITYTFKKVYSHAEAAIKNPNDIQKVTVKAGYIIGDSWEDHLRWPWQNFINKGYKGGRS